MTAAPDIATLLAENSRLKAAVDAGIGRELALERRVKAAEDMLAVAQRNLREFSTANAREVLGHG